MAMPRQGADPWPLEDVTVVDLTQALAGPYGTLLLAGLGARVIKVENPAAPDSCRTNAPYLGRDGVKLVREAEDDVSLSAINRLRNKLGVTLNLKRPRGREVFADLLRQADVVMENFSRGTADRLGVGYAFASGVNPRIVYCSISGFGADGEPGGGKAMDTIIQALSGVMHTTGRPDDPPIRVGFPLADLTAPLFAVIGVLAAVHQARRTGIGQHVDVSMLGALTSLVAGEHFDALEQLGVPTRTGQTVTRLTPFGVFRTSDGHVAICAPQEQFARGLFAAMGRPELAESERFGTRDSRVANSDELNALIERWTGSLTTAECLARLERHGVPSGDVREASAAIRDPLVVRRGETVRLEHPRHGPIGDVYGSGLPIRFSASASGFDRPPPRLGEHNAAVYGELLGYPPEVVDELRAEGVI